MRLILWDFTAYSRVNLTFTFPLPFLTSLVDGVGWQTSPPCHIAPKAEGRYWSYRRQGGLWRRKNPVDSNGVRSEPPNLPIHNKYLYRLRSTDPHVWPSFILTVPLKNFSLTHSHIHRAMPSYISINMLYIFQRLSFCGGCMSIRRK